VLEILYRDVVVVAVHKQPGLMVHRSDLDRLETRFAVQLPRVAGPNVFPAHRLDRGTSGVARGHARKGQQTDGQSATTPAQAVRVCQT